MRNYKLTDGDRQIFDAAKTNGNIFTKFYFSGWEFDDWQLKMHHALQPTHSIVGGMGAGKTASVAMSAAVWAATVPYFKFADVAPTANQSWQMFLYIRDRCHEGIPYYDRFIVKMVEKPYPRIYLYNNSVMEFLSADKSAQKIKNLEADWICLDQAEDVNDLTETIRNIGTRMRGARPDGSPRLSRLTLLANSSDSPEFWEMYDRMEIDSDTYFSYTASTYDNPHNTPEQMKLLESRAGGNAKDIDQHLKAKRPIGSGEFFPTSSIEGCMESSLDRIMENMTGKPGYILEEYRGAGVIRWELPPDDSRLYMQVGDLGTKNPPDRNSGVIMIFDVTEFPKKPAELRAFNWVISDGMITPWLEMFKFYLDYYGTWTRAGFDSTGLQKHFDELSFKVEDLQVMGLNFQGLKNFMLRTLQLFTNKHLFAFPRAIKGIPYQLSRYKMPDAKIAQDIVATLMMAAWMLEQLFWDGAAEDGKEGAPMAQMTSRNVRPYGNRTSSMRQS